MVPAFTCRMLSDDAAPSCSHSTPNLQLSVYRAAGAVSQVFVVDLRIVPGAACADAIIHAGGRYHAQVSQGTMIRRTQSLLNRPIPIDCDLDSYGLSLEAVKSGLEANKESPNTGDVGCAAKAEGVS